MKNISHLFLYQRKMLVLLFLSFLGTGLYAQFKVTGNVTSEGEPLIGVNILVEGSGGIGTATDFDGNYELGRVPTDIYDRFGPNRGFVEGWWSGIISGDNYELFQYKDNQTPKVNLADGKGCFAFFKTEVEPTEPPEIVESCPTTLYPNPTYQDLFVAYANQNIDLANLQLTVFDNLGRLIELPIATQEDGFWLDTRALPSGIYQLRIVGGCEEFVRSFVKVYD